MKNLNLVETTCSIAGQKVHFCKLDLQQQFFQHHRCQILVDHDAFGDKKWMQDPVKIFNLIGESVSITMSHSQTGETNVFIGIVNNATFVGEKGAQNYILIEGVSESIKLEGQPSMDSFVKMTLDGIVNEAVGTSGNGGSVATQSGYTSTIEYIAQYKQSAWDFMLTLCSLYGESLWNDGTTTYFGKPQGGASVSLVYEQEITHYNLRGSLVPPKLKNYEYLFKDDQEWDKQTRKSEPTADGYLKLILDKSDSIYTSEVVTPINASVSDSDSIQKMVDISRTRSVANMLILSGRSQSCKVGIGKALTVTFPGYMEISTSAGEFLLTEVNHSVDQQGHYSNSFSGVRAALSYVPMPPVQMPNAVPERAVVLSNDDPEKLGRIQVQFQWQKLAGKETDWIRVKTNDAGESDIVKANRGLVTIPEKGDTVMISFEQGDPNRPYSSGSLFTSKNGKGGDTNNKTKSFTTRSGSTITFDDEKGSITIRDKKDSESTVILDGEKNITVTAAKSITLTSGDASIKLESDGGGTVTINAKTINITSGEIYNVHSGDTVSIHSDGTLSASSKGGSTLSSSKETTVSGQMKTTVTATGQTIIDGAIVKIN